MPKQLKTYFNSLANTLASKAETAGIFSGRVDIGRCREIISQEFFQKHVSPRFTVNLGGEIFGHPNNCSGQIDIIINHDMSATFKENAVIRCPIESVTAAASIKSTLDKKQLFDALENLASIPQLNKEIFTTSPLTKPFEEYIVSWPSLFIFAFNGISGDTCLQHMKDFYSSRQVPANRIPRAIVVNRKYAMINLHYSNPGNLQCIALTPETIGSPLFWITNEIAKGLSWLNGIYLDYGKYYEEAYLSKS